jgi:hypothetical protein
MMDYDLLLRWASERGQGSLVAFRQAHEWLAHGDAETVYWGWTLQSLQSLGHLEVDWDARNWEIAPPTIATLVNGGGYALLCGARPGWFIRRLDSIDADSDPALRFLAKNIVLEQPVPQHGGPSLRLVTLDQESDAEEVCAALGVQYSPYAADRLLHLLPSLPRLVRAGRRDEPELPGGVLPSRMGAGSVGQRLFEEAHDPSDITTGSYELALFDTRRYFYVHKGGEVFESGRGEVIYMELLRRGSNVLRWDEPNQALLVPTRFRLPQLYERAAVLRTGLLPVVKPDQQTRAKHFHYRNIDRYFAESLSEKLGQKLEVIDALP